MKKSLISLFLIITFGITSFSGCKSINTKKNEAFQSLDFIGENVEFTELSCTEVVDWLSEVESTKPGVIESEINFIEQEIIENNPSVSKVEYIKLDSQFTDKKIEALTAQFSALAIVSVGENSKNLEKINVISSSGKSSGYDITWVETATSNNIDYSGLGTVRVSGYFILNFNNSTSNTVYLSVSFRP